MSETIKLHPSWRAPLEGEFAEPYMGELKSFLLGRARSREAAFSPRARTGFARST